MFVLPRSASFLPSFSLSCSRTNTSAAGRATPAPSRVLESSSAEPGHAVHGGHALPSKAWLMALAPPAGGVAKGAFVSRAGKRATPVQSAPRDAHGALGSGAVAAAHTRSSVPGPARLRRCGAPARTRGSSGSCPSCSPAGASTWCRRPARAPAAAGAACGPFSTPARRTRPWC